MGSSFSFVAIAIPLAFLLAGLILFIVGWRGRIEGSQPVCRKCGFDLTGLPSTSLACPECGSDLTRPRATRSGHLLRRRGPLWTGLILLFMGVASGGLVGTALVREINLNPHKPLWMLVREVGSSDPTVSQPASREISQRMSAGHLSDAQIQKLAQDALALQGDSKRTWQPGWGDFIEAARANGKLSDADWKRYATQGLNLSLEVRSVQERSTASLPYWVVRGPARVGTSTRFRTRLDSRNQTVWVSGIALPPDNGYSTSSGGLDSSGTSKSGRSVYLAPLLGQLEDGPQTLRVKGTLDLLDAKLPSGTGTPPLFSLPFDHTVNWTLQSDENAITLKKDETRRVAVENAVRIASLHVRGSDDSIWLDVTFHVENPPVGIAFDVIARQGELEWKIGRLATPAGNTSGSFGTGGEVKGFTGDTVDIILRPSKEAAAGTTDTFEVWDGEVVFKGRKVELPTK